MCGCLWQKSTIHIGGTALSVIAEAPQVAVVYNSVCLFCIVFMERHLCELSLIVRGIVNGEKRRDCSSLRKVDMNEGVERSLRPCSVNLSFDKEDPHHTTKTFP